MQQFGVRIAGHVPDTGRVARLAAPLIGQPESEISAELSRSGQLVAELSQPEAEALVTQLGELGLEVFIDPVPGTPPKKKRATTDPLHGLASLSAAVPLADALEVQGDEGSTGLFNDPDDSVEKPPRVRPSQEMEPVQPRVLPPVSGPIDPFREAATGLPPPIEGAPPLIDIMPPTPSTPPVAAAVEPPEAPESSGSGRWVVLVVLLLLAAGAVWYFTRPGDHATTLANARAAAAVGQYDKALSLAAQARADGADEALVGEVMKAAQAGPLLDAAETHLAARAWDKARASLDAAADLSPELPRLAGLRVRLERDAPGPSAALAQPKTVASAAPVTVAAAPATAPRVAAPRTAAPESAAPPSVAAPAPRTAAPEESSTGREPAQPRGKSSARLRIDAPRRAAIFVDGRKTGRYTPSTVRLRPGDHRIVLRNPDNGQLWAEREVRAVAGRSSRIDFDGRGFAPARPPAAPPSAAPVTQAAPRVTTLGAGQPEAPKARAPKTRRVDMIGAPSSSAEEKKDGRVQLLGQ